MERVVVAMSGGLDSSVAAYMLKEKGYEVVGLTGKMLNSDSADIVVSNAKSVAESLGIKHYVYDVSEFFHKLVVEYFETSYNDGITPNPCIMCNKFIKWGRLFDYAMNDLSADFFATGHYADIKLVDNVYKLYPAKDTRKDQLYFLYRMTQKQLSKTVFPLSQFDKSQIREFAIERNLPSKDSKESQDICFITKPMTTKKYLAEKLGMRRGDFIEIKSGKKLGEHDGFYFYTIGQRKGIGIAAPYPLYVIDIDAEKNIVYLGKDEDNFKTRLALKDLNFTYEFVEQVFDADVKIRYNMQAQRAKCRVVDEFLEIEFYKPVSSVASGQSGVLYDINDGHLIGGGVVI